MVFFKSDGNIKMLEQYNEISDNNEGTDECNVPNAVREEIIHHYFIKSIEGCSCFNIPLFYMFMSLRQVQSTRKSEQATPKLHQILFNITPKKFWTQKTDNRIPQFTHQLLSQFSKFLQNIPQLV